MARSNFTHVRLGMKTRKGALCGLLLSRGILGPGLGAGGTPRPQQQRRGGGGRPANRPSPPGRRYLDGLGGVGPSTRPSRAPCSRRRIFSGLVPGPPIKTPPSSLDRLPGPAGGRAPILGSAAENRAPRAPAWPQSSAQWADLALCCIAMSAQWADTVMPHRHPPKLAVAD